MANVRINGTLLNNSGYANLDERYGVYENWDAAELAFKNTPRRTGVGFFKKGFTVGILNSTTGKVEEYWLQNVPTTGELTRNCFVRKDTVIGISDNKDTATGNVELDINGTPVKFSEDIHTYFIEKENNIKAIGDVEPTNIKIKNKDVSKDVELNILGYNVITPTGSEPGGVNADTLDGYHAVYFEDKINSESSRAAAEERNLGNSIEALDLLKLNAAKCTFQTDAPTAPIADGGVHIVYLQSEPAAKFEGYIYLIRE